MTKRILAKTFNHIAFPPKLPGQSDSESQEVERDLILRLLSAVQTLKAVSDEKLLVTWKLIENSLKTCILVNDGDVGNKTALSDAFKCLGPDNAIILRVREQNAGVFIRQPHDDQTSIIFEAFESSPTAESTLLSQGALRWNFPGIAVSIPYTDFRHPTFQENLAIFFEKASIEPLDEFAIKSRKAGAEISETRDTVDPAIITQFLMTILETNGKEIYPPVLQKRVKDDVCWDHSELPWRRSPLWLILRVCVQRLLYLNLGCSLGRFQYKALMCSLLAQLLDDCTSELSSEECNFLKSKLCRRLSKLESEMVALQSETNAACTQVFGVLAPLCKKSIDNTTVVIENEWGAWKKEFERKVPPKLPLRAHDNEMRLTLPNSMAYLKEILERKLHCQANTAQLGLALLGEISSKNTTKQFATLTKQYSSLTEREMAIESRSRQIPNDKHACGILAVDLAQEISEYMDAVGDAYNNDPRQMSVFLLTTFELWVHMDKCATSAYPLLYEYHPWFTPELLDVLLLPQLKELKRLQRVQTYLHNRCTRAGKDGFSIFTDPCSGCFSNRYFDLEEAVHLRNLQNSINLKSFLSKERKESELEKINGQLDCLNQKLRESSCTLRRNPDGTHDIRGCNHCYFLRSRRRLGIDVHEDFLPSGDKGVVQKRAVLFELGIPRPFAAYRKTTWDMVNRFCLKVGPSSEEKPEKLLGHYSPLKLFNNNNSDVNLGFTLASTTKSFLGTHYSWKALPATTQDVLLPHGLRYSFYDAERKVWFKEYPNHLSFAHHYSIRLPKEFPFSHLYSSSAFSADGPGPSSYEVIANINECPSQLTAHEFTAHQNLMGGRNRRWFSILIELGSSNLNFSLQDTMLLFQHLVLQAGPSLDDECLRSVHIIFKDIEFCMKLIKQVNRHVEMIASNWRETTYMETLLTLALRICVLGHPDTLTEAIKLLLKIRKVTLDWITLLRDETRNAQEIDVSERAARFCFLSALLCRRTFAPSFGFSAGLDTDNIESFFVASLAMQESLVVDLSKFSQITRNMLVRDIRMSTRMASRIRSYVAQHPHSLGLAVDAFWPEADNNFRKYTEWKILEHPYTDWATSTIHGSENTVPRVIYLHLLEGHLIINGQTLGKLPADIRDSDLLRELFGNQRLFALPSNIPGMDYELINRGEENVIHLGYRNKQLLVRARSPKGMLELVPRNVFGAGPSFDLPLPLISECVHWVDLNSGILEARQKPHIWRNKKSNWVINLHTRTGQRKHGLLVDPFSRLAKTMGQVFHHFEQPGGLTVWQNLRGKLSVEMKRMDLDFFVNKWGQLQCRQLGAVIANNQNAGTLYGLQSMLVLHDVFDTSQRSIIVPLGKIHCYRQQNHVLVRIDNEGTYARYVLDGILQRLHCPAEPRLLYLKAQLHALTSYFLPDPLTGRTGTEEAISCLQSGYCQPWVPLDQRLVGMLLSIANLAPKREYYPKKKKTQQIVHWDPQLTTTIQHDSFRPIINAIISKSQRLSRLINLGTETDTEIPETEPHLRERGQWRRSLYERPGILSERPRHPQDLPYNSRDRPVVSKRVSRVREVVNLLRQQPSLIQTTPNLTKILQEWDLIGGYKNKFTLYSLNECLTADISNEWGALVNLCRDAKQDDLYSLMFQLGLLAFQNGIDMAPMRVIVAFFLVEQLRELEFPQYPSFTRFSENEEPTTEVLLPLVRACCRPYDAPTRTKKEKNIVPREYLWDLYDKTCTYQCKEFVTILINQWPCIEPTAGGFESDQLRVAEALEAVIPEWVRMYQNLELQNHLKKVQNILDRHSAASNAVKEPPSCVRREVMGSSPFNNYAPPQLGQLLGTGVLRSDPKVGFENNKTAELYDYTEQKGSASSAVQVSSILKSPLTPQITKLQEIVSSLGNSECPVRSKYAQDLKKSIAALISKGKPPELSASKKLNPREERAKFSTMIAAARNTVESHFNIIYNSLSQGDPRFCWLHRANLWPCITPTSLLQQLRSTSSHVFGPGMKNAFISYALAITKLQKLTRLKEAASKLDVSKFYQEATDSGHANWDPSTYPDWLLLEIESNMQIRPEQVTVALQMISPSSRSNSVLQMNMGQGKTAVIIPMVAAVLANGKALNRILVPKALLSQAAQVIQSRLGGLLGREITHVPFSRRTQTSSCLIEEYRSLHENMLNKSGIMLGIPEHVLSFKLSGLQRLSDSKITEAVEMMEVQNWMDKVCRDVLDECDFTLAVKTQLIYPGGSQLSIDGHPSRWEVATMILGLASRHLVDLAHDYPQSIDVLNRGPTKFPVAHLLRKDVERAVVGRIIEDICSGQTSVLPIQDCSNRDKEAIREFISQEKVQDTVIKRVSKVFPGTPKARKNVYLLRGLLVHGILILCLKKRWNVQYGLHHHRDPMAVPFYAKGVPSEQAEWGHPDVAIMFTCLAFYYEGLSQKQLKRSLEAVLKSDHPATEYDRWIQGSNTLPEALRHWNIITVDDEGQIAEIWRHLHSTMAVINHFLCNFVFPLHAKQFATKLQASGWDVPSYNGTPLHVPENRVTRLGLTTGFSGTNDNRRLLPLTIEQHDLPGLSHTNAEVLTYLLQPRNREYILAADKDGRRFSEVGLLNYLTNSGIQVLIDAGAYIMEMDNLTVVRTWLQKDYGAPAAVYFAEDNKPWVSYRNGKRAPLIATPFVDNLQYCLVYLDEAHTRGTDLKLPPDAKGALTLGLGQTKDHTVQAAMRLRQLGTTQSVTFISPPEVHLSILDVQEKKMGAILDSSDVVSWLLDQTCVSNRELQALYFSQGADFSYRMQAAVTFPEFLSNTKHRSAYLEVLRQPEQQTLEQLYEPRTSNSPSSESASLPLDGNAAILMQELRQRRHGSNFSSSIISSALEEVEQEREVAYEIEEEREVQRPRRPRALKFPGLHPSILAFAQSGHLGSHLGGNGFIKASTMLEGTDIGTKYSLNGCNLVARLLLSLEFVRTTKSKKGDIYTRPVNWILLSTETETALVLVPEEAELLIDVIRTSVTPKVHLITYAAPFTREMLQFNNLDFYSLPSLPDAWVAPPWLKFELGILSGRLYFEFSEYQDLLDRLHSLSENSSEEQNEGRSRAAQAVVKNRICFLQEWLAVRRQGQDVSHTPMGYVCQGWPLRSEHPFFSTTMVKTNDGGNGRGLQSLRYSSYEEEDDFYDSDDIDEDGMMEDDGYGDEQEYDAD